MKKLIPLLFVIFLFGCELKSNRVIENNVNNEEIYDLYNGIKIINTDKFYEIKDEGNFLIYLYDEKIYSADVIDSIINYSNLLSINVYAIGINTIYTNNLLNTSEFDDNYYFSNNGNTNKTSISNINVYGNEAILQFEEGRIKYTFSETNVILKTDFLENIVLNDIIIKYKEELRSAAIDFFFNEKNNIGKEYVKIENLIKHSKLNNELANVYKESYIRQDLSGIYLSDLKTLNQDEMTLKISDNTYTIIQSFQYEFTIN